LSYYELVILLLGIENKQQLALLITTQAIII